MRAVYAPDQLSELKNSPPLYGVIGFPVAHSLSPSMQLAGFKALHREAQYIRLEIQPEDLSDTIQKMKDLPFAGWNCTLPHKLELAKLVDERGASSQLLGGVNTVINDEKQLIGFNTDGEGWVRAIREEFSLDVRDLRILIIGTGGVGQAIARQAASERCERLVLANRSLEKAQALADELKAAFVSDKLQGAHAPLDVIPYEEEALGDVLNSIDLVVNGTSLGLKPYDPHVLPERLLQPHLCVYDTIYKKTKLQEAARTAGARYAGGLSMLLHQGALSLELWTGEEAPLSVMKDALLQEAGVNH